MGESTKIEWTATPMPDGTLAPGHTQNFWWGCTKVSPGCTNCYALTFSKRVGRDIWGPTAARFRTSAKNWAEPHKWNRLAEASGVRRKVFCQSMSDLFEDHPDANAWRPEVWPIIEATPHLDWLLLTKRPENVNEMVPGAWRTAGRWPSNVWVGTSVESQEWADKRIPALLKVPAPVRFLSCEPLLGPVTLVHYLHGIHWVIVGGESGAKARPMDLTWARSLHAQCAAAAVAFFMKQLGGTRDKGGALDNIPSDLRIRQFPEDVTA